MSLLSGFSDSRLPPYCGPPLHGLALICVVASTAVAATEMPLKEGSEENPFVLRLPGASLQVGPRGAILDLTVEGERLMTAQNEAWLAEPVLEASGADTLLGDDGDRSLRITREADGFRLQYHQRSQSATQRWMFPLSRQVQWSVFPKDGGQTFPVPAGRHLNHNQGARFITNAGPSLDTVNRTFLQQNTRNMGIFIYPGGHELKLIPRAMPASTDLLSFDFSTFPEHHLFPSGPLEARVGIANKASQPVELEAGIQIREYGPSGPGEVLHSRSEPLRVPGDGSATLKARFDGLAPGPYSFTVTAEEGGDRKEVSGVLLKNFDTWELPDKEPADFGQFWSQSLRALRSRPLDPEISEPKDRRQVPEPYREVAFNGLDDRRIRGFLGIPENLPDGKRVPAIITCPGAGYGSGPVDRHYVDRGWVALVLSVHDLPFGGESGRHHPKEFWSEDPYQAAGLESRDSYFYRAAYLAPVRAFDYLTSLPMVDPERIMLAGGSQGGSMTLAAAALEPRFAFAAASIPGRVRFDLLNSVYRANGTFNPPPGMTRETMLRETLAYFDIAYFARRVRVPTWMNMSLNDPINPGPLQLVAYRNIPPEYRAGYTIAPFGGHGEAEGSEAKQEAARQRFIGN